MLAPELQQSLDDVLRLVAQYDLVLATGHVGRDEVFHTVERAQKLGVRKIIVTHPCYDPPALNTEDLRTLAASGASRFSDGMLALRLQSNFHSDSRPNAKSPWQN